MVYLTKSRFKEGLECPVKLYYGSQPDYPNQSAVDPFLEQLADGGFQVEALARLKYENGVMIDLMDRVAASQKTAEALNQPRAVIYEASFMSDQLHVRTDILIRENNKIRLIEVKAKSDRSSSSAEETFLSKKGDKISSGWEAYLWDVAFQTYVVRAVMPDFRVVPYMMLVDKDARASTSGIHQKFKISKAGSDQRMNIQVEPGTTWEMIGNALLLEKNISSIVERILNGHFVHSNGKNFEENLAQLKDALNNDKVIGRIGRKCKDCQYYLDHKQENNPALKSGFGRCWLRDSRIGKGDLMEPKVYDIYYSSFSSKIMDERGMVLAKDLDPSDLNNPKEHLGFSRFDRQSMQLEDIKQEKVRTEIHSAAWDEYRDQIAFPLNMIDFETSSVALPFTKGMRPYETIAFQFSHHLVHENGDVEHCNQWLLTDPNTDPNFEFVRALKESLERNTGSIFRYHNHENTVLNQIKDQLAASDETDRDELIAFIEEITSYDSNKGKKVFGKRCMIDLHRVISDCYYHTAFAHSLSLKVVLPSIIHADQNIQDKYSKPISEISVGSLNFPGEHCWLDKSSKEGLNPYDSLPLPFDHLNDEQLREFFSNSDQSISNGGTAMMAYAKMQYTEMARDERESLEAALLKYCETDTLAMVLIWEHLQSLHAP